MRFFFCLHTRQLPGTRNLIYESLVHASVERLGALDAEDPSAEVKAEKNLAKEPNMRQASTDMHTRHIGRISQ